LYTIEATKDGKNGRRENQERRRRALSLFLSLSLSLSLFAACVSSHQLSVLA